MPDASFAIPGVLATVTAVSAYEGVLPLAAITGVLAAFLAFQVGLGFCDEGRIWTLSGRVECCLSVGLKGLGVDYSVYLSVHFTGVYFESLATSLFSSNGLGPGLWNVQSRPYCCLVHS